MTVSFRDVGVVCASLVAATSQGCRYHGESVDRWYAAANSPSHVEPRTDAEREALARLPTLEDGPVVVTLGGATLSFEPAYASAAHRVCRAFTVQLEPAAGSPNRQVACRDGDSWYLVPDLLEDGSDDGPEDAL